MALVAAAAEASREDTAHDVTVAELATRQVVDCCQKNRCKVLLNTVDKFSRDGNIYVNIQLIIRLEYIRSESCNCKYSIGQLHGLHAFGYKSAECKPI